MQVVYHFCMLATYKRLDTALSDILRISRNQCENLIKHKLVTINGAYAKKSSAIACKDEIHITKVEKTHTDIKQSDIRIDIIVDRQDYVIFNKPRGLVVHGATSVKDPTLSDFLLANNYELSNLSGEDRLGIVHRLDKDTSGAILVAKNNTAHARFSNMLKNREMGRIYICIINKPLKQDCFIKCNIGRCPTNRLKMAKLDKATFPNARDSKSEFRKIIESTKGYELIGVRLYSGRTHQIRLHLSTIGRYIYGDALYSPSSLIHTYNSKMLLHAIMLYFDKECFKAEIPHDMLAFLQEHFHNYKDILDNALQKWQMELIASRTKFNKANNCT